MSTEPDPTTAERCPRCRHAPHDSLGFCPNMASDNDCDCDCPDTTADRAPEEGLRERVEAEDDDQPTGFPGYGDSWLPPAPEAAERVLAFVSWYGDGLVVVESMEPDDQPPLFARDLEAVAKSSAAASEAAPTAGELDCLCDAFDYLAEGPCLIPGHDSRVTPPTPPTPPAAEPDAGDVEALAARLYLADRRTGTQDSWEMLADNRRAPYRVMAFAARDFHRPLLAEARREADARADERERIAQAIEGSDMTDAVKEARAREERRQQSREEAGRRIAALTDGERRRLERDFDRSTREARLISNRGRDS